MLILGLTDGITCGAALVEDGDIVAAINEEAVSRLKMAYGFPRQSIHEVLRIGGFNPAEIDRVTVATNNSYFYDGVKSWDGWFTQEKSLVRTAVFALAGEFGSSISVPGVEKLYYGLRSPLFAQRRRAIRRVVADEFGIAAPLEFVNHHLAHAASAYFTSGFANATVVSMDGGGDGASSHIYDVRDGQFRRVAFTSAYNSLGNYYSYVTHVCGFTAQKHEGKITGLAAHGEPKFLNLLDKLITIQDGQIKNIGGAVFSGGIRALESRLPASWKKEDLAASIQVHSENIARTYVERHLSYNASRNLAIAGGLFANVRINQRLSEIPGVNRLFVHPGMSDAGLGAGSALATCMSNRKQARMRRRRNVIDTVYFGPSYEPTEVRDKLNDTGLAFTAEKNIEAKIAMLLAKGHVVARFASKMEYGPRALGNRSILYHPADQSVNDWLNVLLQRTEFMPFAPSTLDEHAGDYYVNLERTRDSARFMTITFNCTPMMKNRCPGVVHKDGTARPQLVRKEDNPSYWFIIENFRRLTGVATIINTSFNMHEEPIVCTPEDAIRAFRGGHLDYLAIENFLVQSPEPVRHSLHPMSTFARQQAV